MKGVYPGKLLSPSEGFEDSNLLSTVLATPAAGVVTLKFDKERMPAIFAPESAHVGSAALMRV